MMSLLKPTVCCEFILLYYSQQQTLTDWRQNFTHGKLLLYVGMNVKNTLKNDGKITTRVLGLLPFPLLCFGLLLHFGDVDKPQFLTKEKKNQTHLKESLRVTFKAHRISSFAR